MARGLSGQGPGILPGAAALLVALVLQTALEIFDNLDGALGLTACAALMTVSLASATPWAAAAAVAGAGASLGFLLWNRPPAAVHLGNAGSQALALLVSLLVLQTLFPAPASVLRGTSGGFQGPSGVRWAILLPVAWPLFDLLFVTAGRLRRGLPPWRGGRDHTTHRLARALGSDGVVTGMIAVASGLGLAAAVWMHLARR